MIKNPPRTTKILARYESGLLSSPEIATALLVDLVSEEPAGPDLLSSMARLPEEVARDLRAILRGIRSAGYAWQPFLIGPAGPGTGAEPSDPERLRRICSLLEIT